MKNFVISFSLLILTFFTLPICSYATSVENSQDSATNLTKTINSIPFQLNKLQNNPKWKKFVTEKEPLDINYDLYRIIGLTAEQDVIKAGAQDPYGYIVNNHNSNYCSVKTDPKCRANSPLYEYGDIRASSLFDYDVFTDKLKALLASGFITITVNPFPSSTALEMRDASAEDRNLPQNKVAFAETLALEAKLSVVRNSFNNMVLNRLPIELLEGNSTAKKESFSILSIMEQEAKSRFENNNWHTSVDNGASDYLSKEMAKMEAFKIWMEYQKFKQNERIEALLATMVAEQVNFNQLMREQNRSTNAKNR